MVNNGNAEAGPCQSSNGVTSPTGWNSNGTISQVTYGGFSYRQTLTTPGPK